MKTTVHQYYNFQWTFTHDSAPVLQAKKMEIWQDKFSILCRDASNGSETKNLSLLMSKSESGTVFNIYPFSPIFEFLFHYYFLMLFPPFNCYFKYYRLRIKNWNAFEFLCGQDLQCGQVSELTQTTVIFPSTAAQCSLWSRKNCKYLDILSDHGQWKSQ